MAVWNVLCQKSVVWLAFQLVRVWGSRRSYLRSFIGLSLVLMAKVIRVLGQFFGDTRVMEHDVERGA
jgi:hypothetical protein